MRPFLRWAGGKRWLVAAGTINLPITTRYVEPFLGGGAMFFAQDANESLLSDLNPYLINTYLWMQSSPNDLFEKTLTHFNAHSIEYFYRVRGGLSTDTIEDAAAFLYLNRACFNGLFRVNLNGRFNVPIGSKVFELRDRSEFLSWGKHLKTAKISQSDFESIIAQCGEGDFVFVDPPYTVAHNANGFIEYNEKIFGWEDQVRLADCLAKAKGRGASFLLTNADHDSVKALYPENCSFASQERGSEMASKTTYRGRTTELLVASSPEILRADRLL